MARRRKLVAELFNGTRAISKYCSYYLKTPPSIPPLTGEARALIELLALYRTYAKAYDCEKEDEKCFLKTALMRCFAFRDEQAQNQSVLAVTETAVILTAVENNNNRSKTEIGCSLKNHIIYFSAANEK